MLSGGTESAVESGRSAEIGSLAALIHSSSRASTARGHIPSLAPKPLLLYRTPARIATTADLRLADAQPQRPGSRKIQQKIIMTGKIKMVMKLKTLTALVVATLALWFSVAMMEKVTNNPNLTNFAAIGALVATIGLWMVWGLSNIGDEHRESKDQLEKAKRQPAEDNRLALLLELLDEGERQALKRRLADDLRADGEAVSLAELLASQDGQAKKK
jgi:hypothetical protein